MLAELFWTSYITCKDFCFLSLAHFVVIFYNIILLEKEIMSNLNLQLKPEKGKGLWYLILHVSFGILC